MHIIQKTIYTRPTIIHVGNNTVRKQTNQPADTICAVRINIIYFSAKINDVGLKALKKIMLKFYLILV